MKKYVFKSGEWEDDFMYAYSAVAKSFRKFVQEENHIANTYNDTLGEYDYISIANKEKFGDGFSASVRCSFDSFGAPLITLANSVSPDSDGNLRYGDHYEIVAYENGCNIWHITMNPAGSENPYSVEKCAFAEFPIEAESEILITVEISGKIMKAAVNGVSVCADVSSLSDTFYFGITACEGINRFYEAEC